MDVKGWDDVQMDGARDEERQLFIISGHYQAEGEPGCSGNYTLISVWF